LDEKGLGVKKGKKKGQLALIVKILPKPVDNLK